MGLLVEQGSPAKVFALEGVPLRSEHPTVTFTRSTTVADGVFAPGHLGELTRWVPFELVDDVLEQTRTVQTRVRLLPSRVGVYFVLALALFPALGYTRVWGKLTAGLWELGLARPSEKALREVRRRLGAAPLKLLFETLAGPVARLSGATEDDDVADARGDDAWCVRKP